MKRKASVLVLAAIIFGAMAVQAGYSQGRAQLGYGPQSAQAAELKASKAEGKLIFVNGDPALQAKDATYMLHMPQFYRSAYQDGIKEGAAVTVDGYIMPSLPGQDKPDFQVTKAVINGKTYDFTQMRAGGMGRGAGHRSMRGPGYAGRPRAGGR